MLGRDDGYLAALERAHHAHLEAGRGLPAARAGFWVGLELALRGEVGPATGWIARAQRLVEREERDCVEAGYLRLPVMFRQESAGDYDAAYATAAEAVAVGDRFGEADLLALAVHAQGRARLRQGRLDEGLALLDEAMVAVTAGELSPIVTGIVYCSVIEACQAAQALRRAQQWTAALTDWCAEQPTMVAFTGRCLMHRAEIMQVHGAWDEALEEARRARERRGMSQAGLALAAYREGEVQRLQGAFDEAEAAYREASRCGYEPQPGLALLRLAQGKEEVAAAAIRRALAEAADPPKRAALLPASVAIMLAAGEAEEARGAARELAELAAGDEGGILDAHAAEAQGAVVLALGDAGAALPELRRAWDVWRELEAPYEAARVRVSLGLACRALGDEDSAALELEGAREAFAELGAASDLARVESLLGRTPPADAHGLTERELEVLRLVASGRSNRDIAEELVISEHTVARHVQNIFRKLGVSSRTAAGAFAFEHDLV